MNENEEIINTLPLPEKKKLRVAFYLRISTEDQKEMYWIPLQLASLKWILETRHYDFQFAWDKYIYQDINISWSLKIEDRPWMKRLFQDLQYWKPFDVVAIYKIDRLARSLKVLLEIVDRLKENDVDFISSLESIDTSSHFWKAMLGILWVFAELEKNMNQEKMEAWKIQSIKKWNKLNYIYWYDMYRENRINYFKINPEEESIIKSIFEDFTSAAHKWSIWYIINRLKEQNICIPWISRSRKSKKSGNTVKDPFKWSRSTIERILENEVYIWNYYYWQTKSFIDSKTGKRVTQEVPRDKWIKSDIKHPIIISDKLFFKAQEILKSWSKSGYNNTQTSEWNIYIFSWLLKCDACKSHHKNWWMYSWVWDSSHWLTQYKCKWTHKDIKVCKTIPIQASDLEKIILWEIKNIIENPYAIKKYLANENLILKEKEYVNHNILEVSEEIRKYVKWKENLYLLLKLWKIDSRTYLIDDEDLDNKIARKEKEIVELKERLENQFEIEDYSRILKILNDVLLNIENIFEDKEKTRKLIWFLVDEIIIYSEENEWDKYNLSGPKKKWQEIPYRVEVKLKLPQVVLDEFLTINNIDQDDIVWDFFKDKLEQVEKDNEENNKNKKWWWKWGGGWLANTYEEVAKKIEQVKDNLMNNVIRIKNQFSPF